MSILTMISKDHKNAKGLIKKVKGLAGEDTTDIRALIKELVLEVRLHAKSEEIALYQQIQEDKKEFKKFVAESYNEHLLLDTMLDKLLITSPTDEVALKGVLEVINELIEHHGEEEEEEELFPKLREAYSATELKEMGSMMLEAKEELRPKLEEQIASRPRPKKSEEAPRPRA